MEEEEEEVMRIRLVIVKQVRGQGDGGEDRGGGGGNVMTYHDPHPPNSLLRSDVDSRMRQYHGKSWHCEYCPR